MEPDLPKPVARPSAKPDGKREQTKNQNRQTILEAARQVFAELGFGATTVRDIIRATPLASGTFYNYFKDKDEIFAAVVHEMTVELMKRHRQNRAKARNAEEFFRGHTSVYMNFVAKDPEILSFGRNNVTPIRMLLEKPDLQVMSRELYNDLAAAVAQGILPDVDIGYLVAVLSGVVFEASVIMVSRDPVNPDEAIEFATKLMMGGVGNLSKRRPDS